jgi:hypothetical protein
LADKEPCHLTDAASDPVAGRVKLSGAFVVDDNATPERLAQAADLLDRCMGIVMLEPAIVLRPSVREIRCEVVDRPLRWAVVEQRGSELFEAWSDRCCGGK